MMVSLPSPGTRSATLLLVLLAHLGGPVARAQTAPDSGSAPAAVPIGRRLAVNGYVTQAAGISRGGQVFGVPNDGTTDLRRAAILATYQFGADDRVVVQLAHGRVGDAPRAQYLPSLKVDWIFWDHAFGVNTRARVGRFAVPYGIYAEMRYVGTMLPFYQAPAAFYRESDFTNEAIDGAMLRHDFFAERAFQLEITAYGGGLDFVESFSIPGPDGAWRYVTAPSSARQVAGAQAWLNTPVEGFRVGAGANRSQLRGGTRAPGEREMLRTWFGSADGSFERAVVRGELMMARSRMFRASSGYVHVGVAPTSSLWLHVMGQRTHARVPNVPLPPTFAPGLLVLDMMREVSAAAVWAVSPGAQLRAEAHRGRGYHAEEDGVSAFGPARRGRYFLVSTALSF